MPVVLSSKRFSFICRDFSSFFSFDFTTSTTKNPCHCVTKDARLFFGLKGSAPNPEKKRKKLLRNWIERALLNRARLTALLVQTDRWPQARIAPT